MKIWKDIMISYQLFKTVSSKEAYFRWNDAFYPWLRSPVKFHLGIRRPDMVGFPDATTRPLEAEKFTVVVTTYKRPKSVRELLMGLEGLDKMDRV